MQPELEKTERKEVKLKWFKYKAERAVVWALENVLLRQAWVLTREFKKVSDRADRFESEVKCVALNHWQNLQALDERLKKLESKA